MNKIGIIGAGSYGTALAKCFSSKAEEILLLSDIESIASSINKSHSNPKCLPGISLEKNISCTLDISKVSDAELIFITVPSVSVSDVCRQIKEIGIKCPLVLCSKGIDVENGKLLSFLAQEILNENKLAVLSGPSFASEIAAGLPAGINIASSEQKLAAMISQHLSTNSLKIKAIDDIIGLQVAGAFKNILAVGCGIHQGLKLGESSIAKLIVEAIGEMVNLTIKIGGKESTFMELGGIGDIILTCTSHQSRNVLFGQYIASGGTIEKWNGNLAEGAFSAKAVPLLEKKYATPMKIFNGIYKAIYKIAQ